MPQDILERLEGNFHVDHNRRQIVVTLYDAVTNECYRFTTRLRQGYFEFPERSCALLVNKFKEDLAAMWPAQEVKPNV